MIDSKLYSLMKVVETGSFTKAAEQLSLTQPAVSQHIHALENELSVKIFERTGNELRVTREGELVIKYAKRLLALYHNLQRDLSSEKRQITALTIGITHTAESNAIAEALAKYATTHEGVSIKIITDSLGNLYDMLKNYELDFAIVEGKMNDPGLRFLMLDTDCLVLAVSLNHKLAKQSMVTINELKREKLILRLPDSNTRNQFVASLESVLAKSACMDELKKRKIAVLPIENLSMIREINIVYTQDFEHQEMLQDIVHSYNETRGLMTDGK